MPVPTNPAHPLFCWVPFGITSSPSVPAVPTRGCGVTPVILRGRRPRMSLGTQDRPTRVGPEVGGEGGENRESRLAGGFRHVIGGGGRNLERRRSSWRVATLVTCLGRRGAPHAQSRHIGQSGGPPSGRRAWRTTRKPWRSYSARLRGARRAPRCAPSWRACA